MKTRYLEDVERVTYGTNRGGIIGEGTNYQIVFVPSDPSLYAYLYVSEEDGIDEEGSGDRTAYFFPLRGELTATERRLIDALLAVLPETLPYEVSPEIPSYSQRVESKYLEALGFERY